MVSKLAHCCSNAAWHALRSRAHLYINQRLQTSTTTTTSNHLSRLIRISRYQIPDYVIPNILHQHIPLFPGHLECSQIAADCAMDGPVVTAVTATLPAVLQAIAAAAMLTNAPAYFDLTCMHILLLPSLQVCISLSLSSVSSLLYLLTLLLFLSCERLLIVYIFYVTKMRKT